MIYDSFLIDFLDKQLKHSNTLSRTSAVSKDGQSYLLQSHTLPVSQNLLTKPHIVSSLENVFTYVVGCI